MRRASFFLPDDLRDRLAAESQRPPLNIGMGDLRRYMDRVGYLKVFVLSARDGKFLVEPGDGTAGLFKPMLNFWIDASLVRFEGQPVVSQMPVKESPELSLRLNKDRVEPDPTKKPEEPK
jgi:hypothetical protein